MQLTVNNAMEYLSLVHSTLTEKNKAITNVIFEDKEFSRCPASTKYHHAFLGGLALHTAEVVQNCFVLTGMRVFKSSLTEEYKRTRWRSECDSEALLVAALLHDYCKVYEYTYDIGIDIETLYQMIEPGSIRHTEYASRIGHVIGGAQFFMKEVEHFSRTHSHPDSFNVSWFAKVQHIMLAHHGRKEWGSPVEPKTPEAWILHAADMLSAKP